MAMTGEARGATPLIWMTARSEAAKPTVNMMLGAIRWIPGFTLVAMNAPRIVPVTMLAGIGRKKKGSPTPMIAAEGLGALSKAVAPMQGSNRGKVRTMARQIS